MSFYLICFYKSTGCNSGLGSTQVFDNVSKHVYLYSSLGKQLIKPLIPTSSNREWISHQPKVGG